jgi:hypothetical protein
LFAHIVVRSKTKDGDYLKVAFNAISAKSAIALSLALLPDALTVLRTSANAVGVFASAMGCEMEEFKNGCALSLVVVTLGRKTIKLLREAPRNKDWYAFYC